MKKGLLLILMLALIGLSAEGQIMFQKMYTNFSQDRGYSVQQTTDGGYIMLGDNPYLGLDSQFIYLIKTDSLGDTLWTKSYGGNGMSSGQNIQLVREGGYIIIGYTTSFGAGANDVYLIRIDSIGNVLWSKTYGGITDDWGHWVEETTDGGFILTGTTTSFGAGLYDVYLIRTNSIGDTLWTKTFGAANREEGFIVKQTYDGGFIIGAYQIESGGYRSYLIKTDSSGQLTWSKIYTRYSSGIYGIRETADHGFYLVSSISDTVNGQTDFCIMRTDSAGTFLWAKTYGGSGYDYVYSTSSTYDGGFIFGGESLSFGGSVYVVRIDSIGDTLWTKSYGEFVDRATSIHQCKDGGFIIFGYTNMDTCGTGFYLIKTDTLGNSGCHQGNPATIVDTFNVSAISASTIVGSGGIINPIQPILGDGGKDAVFTLCITTGLNELIHVNSSLSIYPNPFTTSTTLTLQGTYHNPSLFIYNLLGQEIRRISIGNNSQLTINRERLTSGMYFYKVLDENKEVIGIGKMVVE